MNLALLWISKGQPAPLKLFCFMLSLRLKKIDIL